MGKQSFVWYRERTLFFLSPPSSKSGSDHLPYEWMLAVTSLPVGYTRPVQVGTKNKKLVSLLGVTFSLVLKSMYSFRVFLVSVWDTATLYLGD